MPKEGEIDGASAVPESTTRDKFPSEWNQRDEECKKGECWHYICKMVAQLPVAQLPVAQLPAEKPSEVQSTTEDTNVWKQVSGRRKGGMAKQKK